MRILRTPGIAAACLLCVSGVAAQTQSGTSKFFLTFGVHGASIDAESPFRDRGGPGLQIGGGYGFTSRFAVFLDAAGASIDNGEDDYVLSHVDLGVRFHFGDRTKAFRPYLEGAFSGRTASLDDQNIDGNDDVDIEISGGAFTIGGGLLYFFNPRWAFNAHLKWTRGEFSRVRIENVSVDGFDIDGRSTRLGVGLSWFPSSAR